MKIIDGKKLEFLISKHTNEELARNKIGCKEVIVHQKGKRVYAGVFGTNPVGAAAARAGMIYRAASMTKPVTSVAVLQLVDKKLLNLDDKISKFFPKAKDLKVAVVEDGKIISFLPLKREITVENLLSHTSGIGCSPLTDILGCKNNAMSLDEAIEDILSKPVYFEPDSAQCYGTTEAFDIAAGIVEKASGIRFDEYLNENIFKPLEMTNTTFCPTEKQWENTVAMHNRTKDGKGENSACLEGCVFENYSAERMPAGAGLVTTAEDYVKFADMLCFFGKTRNNGRILSEKAAVLLSTPHHPANFENWCEKWGLGVRVVTDVSYPHGLGVGCFGWSGAYGTHFWVDRENGISVVMMKNSRYDGGAGNKSACQLERDVCDSLK
ncbi:MAG: beta-lactamase family protein [Clostridia bacterium]|nr:beta-lactamase family protein [Clostridia bacterium]